MVERWLKARMDKQEEEDAAARAAVRTSSMPFTSSRFQQLPPDKDAVSTKLLQCRLLTNIITLRYDMGDHLLNATMLRNGGGELLTMSEFTALSAEQQADITSSLTNPERQAVELAKLELTEHTSDKTEKADIGAYVFQSEGGGGGHQLSNT